MNLIKKYDNKVLYLLGDMWTIKEDNTLQDKEEAYGMVDFDSMQIKISPTMKPSKKLKVIMHEVAHILFDKYCRVLGIDKKDKQEECFCELFEDFAYSLITENDFSKLNKKVKRNEGKKESKKVGPKAEEGR